MAYEKFNISKNNKNTCKSESEEKFESFIKKEYSEVVRAHFKSIDTISTFFKHYLLIMSIPITGIAIFFRFISNSKNLLLIIQNYSIVLNIVFLTIALVGIAVFCYVISLRLDAVLYVTNGVENQWGQTLKSEKMV